MKTTMKLLTLVAGLLTASICWSATQAGDILLAQGAAFVRNAAGIERPAAVGMLFESGETLLTRDGRLQARFSDSGFVSLQPDTQFAVTDYRFQDATNKNDSAIFSLIKGGFRTITGLVGKKRATDYRVDTVTATIGIRGTEYQAVLCSSNCKEPDGLYVHTGEGTIFLKNAAGEVDIGKGQNGYVASPNTAPQRTTTAPAMTARVTESAPPSLPGVGSATDFQPGNIVGANSIGPITPVTGGGLALAASGTLSGSITSTFPGTSSITGSGSGSGSGAGSFGDNNTSGGLFGVYMSGNAIQGGVVSDSTGGVASAVFSAAPVNVGSNGDLYWGRWSGTTLNLFAGLGGYLANAGLTIPATSSIHYLLGTSTPTIPTTGSATYTFVGGTALTDLSGTVGSGITSGQLTANFVSNYVSGSFIVNHGSNYNVSAFMPMGVNNRSSFGTDKGGSAFANSTIPTQVNGFFVGSGAPAGAGISYTIQTGSPIGGVGAFR